MKPDDETSSERRRSELIEHGLNKAAAVRIAAFRRESDERLAWYPAEYREHYDEFCDVARRVDDWEFKEMCRQTMEEWGKTGPWCGLGIPAAYYACRYEDNAPRSEYEKIKARMDELEEKFPGLTAIMKEAESVAMVARESSWKEHVDKHLLLD